MKHRMLLVLLSASLGWPALAAEPPVIPADPAKKKPATTASKKPAAPVTASKGDEIIPLPTPEPGVVSQKAVVVRGQPRINSEIVTRLKKGDKVTVLEEIKTKKRADEPDRWYKIALPTGSGVWVDSRFLDGKKVNATKLNVRTGPSENYSVIARLEKGTELQVIETKGDWARIEPPSTAVAYVAAHLISREPAPAPAVVARNNPPPPPPPPPPPVIQVTPPPPIAQANPVQPVFIPNNNPVIPPPPPPPPPPVNQGPVVVPSIVKPVLIPVQADEPLPKRIVTREGIVRGSVSVQAPTHFVLRSLDNSKTINYLFSTTSNITVREYRGQRVIVTGEEQLDERWPNTPVIEIETLQPLE